MNGLLMFMNVSVTEVAFTMWFATTTPGKASCKTKQNYYILKTFVLFYLFNTSYIFLFLVDVTVFYCKMLEFADTGQFIVTHVTVSGIKYI
jgi:hypothetical protein